jgi:translation elongation factor EF-1beta
MPFGIGENVKSGVIYEWLRGSSRDKIAGIYKISTGGVTNIVNEWRNSIGDHIAKELREFSISLKKANITPIQCSTGFRVAKIMQRLGITEDQFESFMSNVYNRCQKLEVQPDQIEKYLTETINISKIVFPSQIPHYINSKKIEIENLEQQIEDIQKTIVELNIKKSTVSKDLELMIETSQISNEAIAWYKDILKELKNKGLSLDNISFFIQCLMGIKNEGYDVNKVLTKYSELIYFDKLEEVQNHTIQKSRIEIEQLTQLKKSLNEEVNWNRLKLSKNQELENIGFGIKELKILYNTIIEISKENTINPKEAAQKFFSDMNDYDDIVGFKKKVEELRKEGSNLNMQIANNRIILSSQQYISTILQNLLIIGISEEDIADINSILLLGGFEYYNNDSNNLIINKQSLISELMKYRNIQLVTKSLEQKEIQLTDNITELENQKLVIQNYINILLSMFYNLVDLHTILKKATVLHENPKIILIIYLLYSFFKDDKRYSKDYDDSYHEKNDNNKDTDKEDE